jgi:hypothetical protein
MAGTKPGHDEKRIIFKWLEKSLKSLTPSNLIKSAR